MDTTIIISLLLLVASISGFSIGTPLSSLLTPRIVGGEITTIENVPWQAQLLYFKTHRCGAAILNETTIITAAHCTEKVRRAKSLSVRVGSSYRSKGGDIITVVRFANHPKYRDEGLDHDIALLWLERPIQFSSKVQPVQLPEFNEPIPSGSLGIASGWGRLYENGLVPDILHSIVIPIWQQDDCIDVYKKRNEEITDNMLCAGVKQGGKDSCQKDSGGPLVVGKKLVGVISWAYGCGRPNSPGVYARVAAMKKWIDEARGMSN